METKRNLSYYVRMGAGIVLIETALALAAINVSLYSPRCVGEYRIREHKNSTEVERGLTRFILDQSGKITKKISYCIPAGRGLLPKSVQATSDDQTEMDGLLSRLN